MRLNCAWVHPWPGSQPCSGKPEAEIALSRNKFSDGERAREEIFSTRGRDGLHVAGLSAGDISDKRPQCTQSLEPKTIKSFFRVAHAAASRASYPRRATRRAPRGRAPCGRARTAERRRGGRVIKPLNIASLFENRNFPYVQYSLCFNFLPPSFRSSFAASPPQTQLYRKAGTPRWA